MKVLILLHHRFELWTAPEWLGKRLAQEFPQVSFVQRDSYEALEPEIGDAEVFIGWSLRPEQFAAARRLRWIHSPAAAVHQLMVPEVMAGDVVVTNARDVHGPVVAEHAIAVLLALAKRLPSAVRHQQQRRWAQQQLWAERPRPREVAGAVLGLVGMGAIGREVAGRAVALGMRVLAVREHPERENPAGVQSFGTSALDDVLPQCDYVVLAAPLTAATRQLINAARLARMKPDAYLINVSRGPLIDDAALIAALRKGRLAGAALDVFAAEPLSPASPYWELENVLITPHTAAVTEKLWDRHFALIAENLRRYLAGRPLLSVVDKRLGY